MAKAMRIRSVLASGLCLLAAAACRPNEREPAQASRTAEQAAEARGGAPVPRSPRAIPVVQVAYDDPRLAGVRELEHARDFSGAAKRVDAIRLEHASDPSAGCAWAHLSGRLHAAAGEPTEASLAFDAVKDGCPIAPYARLRAAQALAKEGRWDESLSRANGLPPWLASEMEVKVVSAEAHFGRGDRGAGVVAARRILADEPRGPRWIDMSIRVAVALLDGVAPSRDALAAPPPTPAAEKASAAREALELVTRVVVEAPKIAESSGAERTRQRAIAALRGAQPPPKEELDETEKARRAQGWLDANEAARALSEANALMAAWPKKGRSGELPCKVTTTRARAVAKTKQPAADAWGDAIRACAGTDELAGALYNGGKASLGANRADEAAERFAKLEQQFPKHRLADDARLYGASIARDAGDEARFTSMLLSVPDDYPDGDMRTEGLFRVALLRMNRGDWAGAIEPVDRILTLDAGDGRAAYFRARIAEARGEIEDAKQRYAKILEDQPFTFYMLQAYARLASLEDELAARTLDAAAAREPNGPFVTKEHPELTTPEFDRAVRLLEVGEVDAARRELTRAAVVDDAADPELVWIVGDVYNRAGAWSLGHAFARRRLRDQLLAHHPAGTWRFAWEVAYPRAFESFVKKEAEQRGVPRSLAWGVMREESTFVAEAKSHANAYGLMQLILPTAKGVAKGTGLPWDEDALKRPDVNIALGTKLLGGLRNTYAASRPLAIAAYNAGGGAVNRWLARRTNDDFDLFVENIPYDETRGYIKKVLASQAAYAYLYERPALKEVLTIPARVAP